jgi:hypothetical protein
MLRRLSRLLLLGSAFPRREVPPGDEKCLRARAIHGLPRLVHRALAGSRIDVMPPCRFALTVGLAAALTACASMHALSCRDGAQSAIHDSLYFGTGKPNGVVTPQEWAEFLKGTVTPRFPQGLTVSPALGQWRGADGAIVRETSHVLQLVHPDDAASESAVLALVAEYKAKFQQEAVLRVKAQACVSF